MSKLLPHKLYVDDVMMYIIASLPNTTFDSVKVNIAFYDLKKKYPDCFNKLHFYTGGTYPISERICSMIARGYICGMIVACNYFSDEKKESFINHVNKKLTPEQLDRINEIINVVKTEKLL